MSASTRTVPAQIGFGRFPTWLAALAVIAILAVSLAIVALNSTKSVAPVVAVKAIAPPAVIDHGWSNGETVIVARPNVPFYDHNVDITGTYGSAVAPAYGGFGGPRLGTAGTGDASKDDTYVPARTDTTGSSIRMRAQ
ncbi:MAG: hypothetical protein ACJ765_04475 [Chloroflexota bacterium]